MRNQLCLARPFVQAMRQPWERKERPATPQQVRRAMGRILLELGTPAKASQPRGKSPGWLRGRQREPAPTYPVIKKEPSARKTGRPMPKRRARYTTITLTELLRIV